MTARRRTALAMGVELSTDTGTPLPTRAQLLASRPPVTASEPTTADTDDDTDDDDTPDPVPVDAARHTIPVRGRRTPAPAELSPGRAIQLMLAAQTGHEDARRALQAAAGDLDVTKLAGLVPPQYANRIIGDTPARRRIFDNAVAHEALWSTGMTLNVPDFTDHAQGGWIATDGGAIPTDDITIGYAPVAVKLWGHAAKASYALIERSSPEFVAAYYRDAIRSFYRDVETDLRTVITGAATASGITSTEPAVKDVFTMAAEVLEASSTAGVEAEADVALCHPTVWADLFATAQAQSPAYATGRGDAPPSVGFLAGLKVVAVPSLAAGDLLVGDSTAVRAYGGQSEAVRLAALVVGVSQWQHGVLAEFARAVENTHGWVKHNYTGAATRGGRK